MWQWKHLRRWFPSKGGPRDTADAHALRLEFQARYHQFKLLLNANHQALAIMAELEKALEGSRPFGMQFVRAKAIGAYTRVHQIVNHLQALAPGRYKALTPRLEAIRADLDALTAPFGSSAPGGSLVLHLCDLDKNAADQAGMKMANLGELSNGLQLRVPDGFVLTAAAFQKFLEHNDLGSEIRRRIQIAEDKGPQQLYATSAGIRSLIQAAPLPADLETAIMEAYNELAHRQQGDVRLAVRSSGLNEDRADTSFAGLYHSVLNISRDQLINTYKEIVAAAYSPAVMAYRLNRGICDDETQMCVGVIRMVDAVCGGVIYSANPLNIRDGAVVINSAWGLPKAVVDGTTATDCIRVVRRPTLSVQSRENAHQTAQYNCAQGEGVRREALNEGRRQQLSLTDNQALELAAEAIQIEGHYGRPQDIEWAIDKAGEIVFLQCRPLQIGPDTGRSSVKPMDRAELPPLCYQGGTTASSGVAAGPAFKVVKEVDALQFPTGAILITDRALARWAALLPRAAAVVSERGGISGHLANVAREYKLPALFGASGAIEALAGQDMLTRNHMITVDADTGSIYTGKATALLTGNHEAPTKTLMQGTHVYAALEKTAARITPLTLIDPDSPSFRADRCRTLHDVTRFCHEKSVHEMFRFGKAHHFPERSSKQLRARIPMQWWVLNLDDGLIEDSPGERYVDIDNVASLPMRALWEGITAVPWKGPPPVDGKGFAAVMFGATRNQALLPTVRTTMANRNYFMIARNYCSLQSRLGFHFAITEALVGERTRENYISFQFKGGAADEDRRLKRVILVKEILDAHGFRTEVGKDALHARIEQLDAGAMTAKLKILGYLTIHTRQLDMIMGNPAMVAHYRTELSDGIASLLDDARKADDRCPHSRCADAPYPDPERTPHVVAH